MLRLRFFAVLLLALGLGLAPLAQADDVPRATGVLVDGRADEPAWKNARELPVETVETPALPPAAGVVPLVPRLAVVESDGRLCFSLEVDEDPGATMGLLVKIAPDGTTNAADALEVAYRPMSLRAARFVVRGPAGVGRGHYPVEGAAVWNERGRWALELAIWLGPIVGDGSKPLRVGAAVLTRTPNLWAASPPGAVFHGPDAWHVLAPVARPWATGEAPVGDAMQIGDAAEVERLVAWNRFLEANVLLDREQALVGRAEDVLATIDAGLVARLEAAGGKRPELVPGVETIRGDVLRQLGLVDDAQKAFDAALAAAPGWREARMLRAMTVGLHRMTERPPDQPSDFGAARAMLDAVHPGDDPWLADAVGVARGILLYREGRFTEAEAVLAPFVTRYPFARLPEMTWAQSRKDTKRFLDERNEQRRDEKRDLPRVRLVTSKGPIVAELFQAHAPHAVNNFVWLARQGFFDGMAWHRNVPFLGLQSGDPFSKASDLGGDPGLVGLGGPGYQTPAVASGRMALRGALAMVRTGTGAEGSQFMLLTGTASHAEDQLTVFGRIVEGQDVADRLVASDRLESVEVLHVREGWDYHPTDLAGRRPERPVATAPPPPGGRR